MVLRQRTNEAFDKIKKAVTSTPVPKYFDTSKPTEGSGDASSKGVGFVLTQDDHPVTYASRALTQAEQHYSQIKEEFLAQVFGLEHNHQYVYGRNVRCPLHCPFHVNHWRQPPSVYKGYFFAFISMT